MYGTITYDSPSCGKLYFTFQSADPQWDNPHSAALEAARGAGVKGRFCIFKVDVIEGITACREQLSVGAYYQAKERLLADVKQGIENFEAHCAGAKVRSQAPGQNLYAWPWMNSAQNKLYEIKAMLKHWEYDTTIWPV